VFCPNCGTQNDDNGVKCQKCGFNLKGAAAPKFKGTMLMMNSPMAQAARPAAPAGAPPGQVPWPKSAAKATMIGVAPPSPGAVAPPNKSPVAPPVVPAAGAPAPAHAGQSMPRPVPPAAGGTPPVNPFGGTMLMGAVPPAQPVPAAVPQSLGADLPPTDRTVTSEGAPLPNISAPANLESTTPSAAPAPKAVVATQNEMAVFGTADTAPPPAAANFAPGPEFPKPAAMEVAPLPAMPASAYQPRLGKIRPIGLVVVLGFITFGIYWLVAMLGALKDFNAIRGKNDVNPILFIIPILGLLETLKLPGKVVETRAAVGVSNPVAPNVVLYLLFPQIFFIADLNELVEATNRRTSIS
jgi:hypothetical protein